MLVRGIDTLEFSLDVKDYLLVFGDLLERLEELKREGQERGKEAEVMLNGLNLKVEKSGMPFYAYRLTCKDFVEVKTVLEGVSFVERVQRRKAEYMWSRQER